MKYQKYPFDKLGILSLPKDILNIKYFLSFICIFTICYLIFNIGKADAAGLDLGIEPPILQIEAEPPAKISAPITIENFGSETIELEVFIKPFVPSKKETGDIVFLLPNEPLPGANPLIYQNITVSDKSFSLAPGQQRTVELRINIGKNEPISDYYFSVVFISNAKAYDQSSNTVSAGGIATNVILTIGPTGKAQGAIEEFSAPFFTEKGPVPFTVRIKNKGVHAIAPQGGILIENMFGQTVGKVELLPVNILSNSIRAIPDSLQSPEATPTAALESLILNHESPKAFWHESFLIGPYKAKLTIALSRQGPVYSRTISFFALPTYAILGLLAALSVVVLIVNRVRSKL